MTPIFKSNFRISIKKCPLKVVPTPENFLTSTPCSAISTEATCQVLVHLDIICQSCNIKCQICVKNVRRNVFCNNRTMSNFRNFFHKFMEYKVHVEVYKKCKKKNFGPILPEL